MFTETMRQLSVTGRWRCVVVALLIVCYSHPVQLQQIQSHIKNLQRDAAASTPATAPADAAPADGGATCPPGHFLRQTRRAGGGGGVCTACSECPAGFGVRRPCGGRSDTYCEACMPGRGYLKLYFGVRKCFSCSSCSNREVLSECGVSSNRVCGLCKQGFFFDELTEGCLACSYCYPEVPGYGVVEPTCATENQPSDYTCLPSLPPRELRTTTAPTPTPKATMKEMLQRLDRKLNRLGRLVLGELDEARVQLQAIKTQVTSREN